MIDQNSDFTIRSKKITFENYFKKHNTAEFIQECFEVSWENYLKYEGIAPIPTPIITNRRRNAKTN